jgi:hypothetical protein
VTNFQLKRNEHVGVFFNQGISKAPPIRTDKYMARKPGGRVGTAAPRCDTPSSTSKKMIIPSSKKRARSTPVEITGEKRISQPGAIAKGTIFDVWSRLKRNPMSENRK